MKSIVVVCIDLLPSVLLLCTLTCGVAFPSFGSHSLEIGGPMLPGTLPDICNALSTHLFVEERLHTVQAGDDVDEQGVVGFRCLTTAHKLTRHVNASDVDMGGDSVTEVLGVSSFVRPFQVLCD